MLLVENYYEVMDGFTYFDLSKEGGLEWHGFESTARIVGDSGRVVPRRDPEALAAALSELIEIGPAKRQGLGGKARERVKENFTCGMMLGAYESLFQHLVRGGMMNG